MTVSYEELEAQAQDNRRKLMSSSLFGDDESQQAPPRTAEPPVVHQRKEPRVPEASSYVPHGTTLTDRLQRAPPPRQSYVDDMRSDSTVPSISPFGTFRFDIVRPGNVSDLGFQRRGQNHILKATRIELQGTGELRQIREEMARQAAAYADRAKGLVNDEPLNIGNENITQPLQDTQSLTAKSEFMFPGTQTVQE